MKAKFKIDLKSLEVKGSVWIDKDLYAKKLTDSIEIYEIKPLELTSEDKESISEALKKYDKLDDIICEKISPIILFIHSLEEKYCINCPKNESDIIGEIGCHDLYVENKATCELSYLRWNDRSFADGWHGLTREIYNMLEDAEQRVDQRMRLKAELKEEEEG